ncbi:hypothetical protein [Aliicoccus persicus]|uniref:Uncharacterized protein n=1 Tax=Aliicoccus persicus TaxID=930138 RepID=A0A662Z4T4_9STAP|nr:hypothetical protein [Aliicoccus persicus]SEV97065.1 hypothetical protein SAMN05192557_1069 [Aliicoccus persicus]
MERLNRKETNIILHSEEVSKYPELLIFMGQFRDKGIKKNDISSADEKSKEYISEFGGAILNNARHEYNFTNEVKSDRDDYQCQLCNQKNLKSLYLIENMKNESKFWVGSSCIKEFGFEKKTTDLVNVALEMKFNKEFPQYNKLLNIERHPIVIPNTLISRLKKTQELLKQGKKEFIKSKGKNMENCLINESKIENIKKEIQEYVEKNINNDWVVNTEVIEWYELLDKKTKLKRSIGKIIARLKEDGHFKSDELHPITEKNHRFKIREKFRRLSNSNEYNFILDDSNNMYVRSKVKRIVFDIDETALYALYADKIYSNEKFEIESELLKIIEINKSIDNLEKFFKECKGAYHIESFIVSDNKLFVDADENYLYELDLKKTLSVMKSTNSIISFRNSNKTSKKFKKDKFNDYVDSLNTYRSRIIINKQKGIKYGKA